MDDAEKRFEALEAKSMAQSICVSAALIALFRGDEAELRQLRDTICDGMESSYERGSLNHSFLQQAIAEVETIFRLMQADRARQDDD